MRSLALLSLVVLSPITQAEPVRYRFDTVHSQVHASASHLGFSQSTGRFPIKEGMLEFDPNDWSQSKVAVRIDATRLDFGDATWNEHMQADKFFHTAEFPEILFRSTQVTGSGSRGTVEGELVLLGQAVPVSLDVTLNKIGENPFSKKATVGFSATATIERSDWGMTAYVPNVGDEVRIRIEVEAAREDPEA